MGKPVIYLDTLLAVNLCINYVLLLSTARFLGIPYRKGRLLLGALAGATGALSILLPKLSFWLDPLLRLALSAAMVLLSFRVRSWRSFVKALCCLFGSSFSLAGLLLALSALFHPPGLVLKNSAVYLAVSPVTLLGAAVLCYFGLCLLHRIAGRRRAGELSCVMTLRQGEREATLSMKIDTGNHLTEPFSGLPVAVAERSALAAILPERFPDPFSGGGFRMVPCHTVTGEGLLPSFRPQFCRIRMGNTVIETTSFYIGVSEKPLLPGYDGLLQPEILSTGTERKGQEPKIQHTEASK